MEKFNLKFGKIHSTSWELRILNLMSKGKERNICWINCKLKHLWHDCWNTFWNKENYYLHFWRNTIWNLEKYIQLSENAEQCQKVKREICVELIAIWNISDKIVQIQFVFLEKYILKFGQIHFNVKRIIEQCVLN